MHQYAEYGVASHWSYKQKKSAEEKEIKTEDFKWIKELVDLGKSKMSSQEYLKHVKLNVYQDRIFVLTPKGDAIDLPKGASVIDFAFKIHAYIGEHASLAKVNGQVTKLNTVLKNGDIVEILTDKKQKPSSDWLTWVRSSGAAKHIRRILRNLSKKNL
jgi:GTP pyrophosphokinase